MERQVFTLKGTQYAFSLDDALLAVRGQEPDRIYKYFVEINGENWPVKQVLSLMINQPNDYFTSNDSQRILSRLGLRIMNVSEGPQTLPPSAPVITKKNSKVKQKIPAITLVGCVKSKLKTPAKARDLYTSSYFAKMRDYAERVAGRWFILSAKHGLVSPDQRLTPTIRT